MEYTKRDENWKNDLSISEQVELTWT